MSVSPEMDLLLAFKNLYKKIKETYLIGLRYGKGEIGLKGMHVWRLYIVCLSVQGLVELAKN